MGERLIHVGEESLLRIPREVLDLLDLAEGQEVELVVEDGQAKLVPVRPPWRVPIEFHLLPGIKREDIEFFTEEDLIEWSNQGSDFDEEEITWPQEDIDRWLAQSNEESKPAGRQGQARRKPATSGSSASSKAKERRLQKIVPR